MIRGSRAAIVLTVVLAASRLAAPIAADEFSDFQIPDHRLFSWTGSLSSGVESAQGSSPQTSGASGSGNGHGSMELTRLHDSEGARTVLGLTLLADGERHHDRDEDGVSSSGSSWGYLSTPRRANTSESWAGSFEHRGYPWRMPWGWQVNIQGRGVYGQTWQRESHEYSTSSPAGSSRLIEIVRWDSKSTQYSASGDLRFGYGKVRDATGVLEVRAFEERLRRSGALKHALSSVSRKRLADIAYTEGDVIAVRDRPAKTLWRAVEKVLREDTSLVESSLPVEAAEAAAEPLIGPSKGRAGLPLRSSRVTRMSGYFAGLTLGGITESARQHAHSQYEIWAMQNDSTTRHNLRVDSSREHSSQDDVRAGVRLEYSKALSWRWQFDATSQLQVPIRSHRDGLATFSDVRLLAIFADRWTGELFMNHQRRLTREGGAGARMLDDNWTITCGGSATLYLEDRLQLQLSLTENQSGSSLYYSSHHQDMGASLVMTYRLAGRTTGPIALAP